MEDEPVILAPEPRVPNAAARAEHQEDSVARGADRSSCTVLWIDVIAWNAAAPDSVRAEDLAEQDRVVDVRSSDRDRVDACGLSVGTMIVDEGARGEPLPRGQSHMDHGT
jgi:hypothetical protein